MAITWHKATATTGGAIGDEISSGDVGALLPEITQADQLAGVTISRKFYIKNTGADDYIISAFSMEDDTVFSAILFESTGDSQVVGDLTGAETDESPIGVVITGGSHSSFWIQMEVPAGSTKTEEYGAVIVQ